MFMRVISKFFIFFRNGQGPTSVLVNLLPHIDMAWLPGIKQFVGLDIPEKVFSNLASFITPIIDEYKKTLDEDSHR